MEMLWFLTSVHCHCAGYQNVSFHFLFRQKEFAGTPGLLNINIAQGDSEITWKQ